MRGKSTVNRGDIFRVNLEPARGSEMNKKRPCLVVSNDTANKYSRVVAVVALTTTAPRKTYPFIVEVPASAKMPMPSWIDCAHIRSVDRERLSKYLTSLDAATMRAVEKALSIQLGLAAREDQRMAG